MFEDQKHSTKREGRYVLYGRSIENRILTAMIDPERPLRFEDVGVTLPKAPATQVISIRLPSALLNEIRAFASQRDILYQAAIKLFLAESIERRKKRAA